MNCCCSQEGNVYEVNNLYETSFPKLTDQFFKVRSDKNTPGKCGNWYIWHFTSRKTQGKIIQFSSKLFSQGVTMARSRGRGPLCQWWPHLPQPLQVPFHWGLHHLNIARIANAVQCHSQFSCNKDCHDIQVFNCQSCNQCLKCLKSLGLSLSLSLRLSLWNLIWSNVSKVASL